MSTETTSYDRIPYPSYPFRASHPDRLATIARLFGMRPAPVDRCRVLELGCASGGNLLPMAAALADSTFLGLDRSSRQIADGNVVLRGLELSNAELRNVDLLDVDRGLGEFDYIICHGVFSWVPRPVQDKVLQICHENLARDGVAYVSYNTYPGWHMRGMIREMMLYHGNQFDEPARRISEARGLLDFLSRSVPPTSGPYGALLKGELETLRQQPDAYLFHEQLEKENDPIYFHQFIERAQTSGLQFLGETELSAMCAANLGIAVEKTLRDVAPTIVQMEQYMDFVRNRMFRQTLLCHADHPLTRNLSPASLSGLYVAANLTPKQPTVDCQSAALEEFQGAGGMGISTGDPIVKATLVHLKQIWPQSVRFEALQELAASRCYSDSQQAAARSATDTQILGSGLIKSYAANLIELSTRPADFVAAIGVAPVGDRLARRMAGTGTLATNRRHELVRLNDLDRQVLLHADGNRDQAAIAKELVRLVEQNVLQIQANGQKITSAAEAQPILAIGVAESLPRLARDALLVG
jgi:methyltransferase-like protein